MTVDFVSSDDDIVVSVTSTTPKSRKSNNAGKINNVSKTSAASSASDAVDAFAVLQSLPTPELPDPSLLSGAFSYRPKTHATDTLPLSFEADVRPNCLQGLTFVLTGQLPNYDRDELANCIKRLGGRVTTSISGKTNCVVFGDDAGPSKLQKALALKVKIINEQGFIELMAKLSKPKITRVSSTPIDSNSQADSGLKPEVPAVPVASSASTGPTSSTSSTSTTSSTSSTGTTGGKSNASDMLWTDKYKPTSLNEVLGNRAAVSKLSTWISKWPSNEKACMLYGPPGIGKTTCAHLIAKQNGYEVIEYNASDTRSKSLLQQKVAPTLGNRSLGKQKQHSGKILVILDEVDGMSAGDRGGVGQMAALCRSTEVPLILICNDRHLPKMKPFDRVVLDIDFRKPDAASCAKRVHDIAAKEGLDISTEVAIQILQICGSDLRQVLNLLQHYKTTAGSMNAANGKTIASKWLKEQALGPFEAVQKLLSNKNLPINESSELYFSDDLVPLMVAENYNSGLSLKEAVSASESISLGDLVEKSIRQGQNWSLMPLHAVFSTVVPAKISSTAKARGSGSGSGGFGFGYRGLRFPTFLGNLSSTNRRKRELNELTAHVRLKMAGSAQDIRLDMLTVLNQLITAPLVKNNVGSAIEFMDNYFITKDDYDAMVDMSLGAKINLPTATKSAFTRTYNKQTHPLPFMRAKTMKETKSEAMVRPDLETEADKEVIDPSEIKTEEEKLEEAMKNDKYISAKNNKRKAAAKDTGTKAKVAKTSTRGGKTGRGRGRGRGK